MKTTRGVRVMWATRARHIIHGLPFHLSRVPLPSPPCIRASLPSSIVSRGACGGGRVLAVAVVAVALLYMLRNAVVVDVRVLAFLLLLLLLAFSGPGVAFVAGLFSTFFVIILSYSSYFIIILSSSYHHLIIILSTSYQHLYTQCSFCVACAVQHCPGGIFGARWRLCRLAIFDGRRSESCTSDAFCVTGVAFCARNAHFVWPVQYNTALAVFSGPGDAFVAWRFLMTDAVNRAYDMHIAWCVWHSVHTVLILCGLCSITLPRRHFRGPVTPLSPGDFWWQTQWIVHMICISRGVCDILSHSAHFVWPVQYNTALAAFSGPGDAFVAWRFLMTDAVNRAYDMHIAWCVWHSVHTVLILCGLCSTTLPWRHFRGPVTPLSPGDFWWQTQWIVRMICISRGVCDILCTQCSFCVACAVQHCPGGIFGARWRLCRLAIFDDRRSESCVWYAYRVVCVTFCARSAHFVWPVQYNTALAAFSGPGDAFVAWRFLMTDAVNRAYDLHIAWYVWHSVHTVLILCGLCSTTLPWWHFRGPVTPLSPGDFWWQTQWIVRMICISRGVCDILCTQCSFCVACAVQHCPGGIFGARWRLCRLAIFDDRRSESCIWYAYRVVCVTFCAHSAHFVWPVQYNTALAAFSGPGDAFVAWRFLMTDAVNRAYDMHIAWCVWHSVHTVLILCGLCSTTLPWRHFRGPVTPLSPGDFWWQTQWIAHMICISRGVCDILCTQRSFCVACAVQHCSGGIFGARWRLCRLAIFDDRRSESCVWYAYRVVCVTFCAHSAHFVWPVQYNTGPGEAFVAWRFFDDRRSESCTWYAYRVACVTFCAHSAHFVWPVQYNTALVAFSGPGDAFVAWRFLMTDAVNRAYDMHMACAVQHCPGGIFGARWRLCRLAIFDDRRSESCVWYAYRVVCVTFCAHSAHFVWPVQYNPALAAFSGPGDAFVAWRFLMTDAVNRAYDMHIAWCVWHSVHTVLILCGLCSRTLSWRHFRGPVTPLSPGDFDDRRSESCVWYAYRVVCVTFCAHSAHFVWPVQYNTALAAFSGPGDAFVAWRFLMTDAVNRAYDMHIAWCVWHSVHTVLILCGLCNTTLPWRHFRGPVTPLSPGDFWWQTQWIVHMICISRGVCDILCTQCSFCVACAAQHCPGSIFGARWRLCRLAFFDGRRSESCTSDAFRLAGVRFCVHDVHFDYNPCARRP